MAGLRCGYCVAQPEKIELMRAEQVGQRQHMAIVAGSRVWATTPSRERTEE